MLKYDKINYLYVNIGITLHILNTKFLFEGIIIILIINKLSFFVPFLVLFFVFLPYFLSNFSISFLSLPITGLKPTASK